MRTTRADWFVVLATLLACALAAASACGEGACPQHPMPPQAPQWRECACFAGQPCVCGEACPCPGGRRQLTSTHGTRVWFRRVNGQWQPEEPGWHYDAQGHCWRRLESQPVFHTPPPVYAPPMPVFRGFAGGFGGGGGRGGGC